MRFFIVLSIISCFLLSSPAFAVERPQLPTLQERISYILDQYRKNYPGGPIQFQHVPDAAAITPADGEAATNEDQTLLYPNQKEPSVQETHAQAMNAPFLDNRTSALSMPNQNERSNEDFIHGQLRAMGVIRAGNE